MNYPVHGLPGGVNDNWKFWTPQLVSSRDLGAHDRRVPALPCWRCHWDEHLWPGCI